jgi:CPA1 family monovalent cation:H+ antiporter
MLTYQSRIQGINVWSNIVFVLNGLIFLLIGLQLPTIITQLGETSLVKAIWYGLLISLVLIITRLLCTLGASLFTRFMSRFITVADDNPGWREPLVLGWAGMRGVVSLAAALSIPLVVKVGQPFPYRDLVLFITFIVILTTLVFQGLTLPWLIRKVKLEDRFTPIPEQEQEINIQKKITQSSLHFLEESYGKDKPANEHVNILYEKLKKDLDFFNQELEEIKAPQDNSLKNFQHVYLELLQHQRKVLAKINRNADYSEELIRKYLSLIDMEEFKIREEILQPEERNV